MTFKSNPRLIIVYVVIGALVAASLAALVFIGALLGLIALAVVLFVGWSILRVLRRQMATRLETLTDEIVFTLGAEEKVVYTWAQIRVAGIAIEEDDEGRPRTRERRLFIYNEETDKMIALTDEFENLDGLAAELREKTDFREVTLHPGETLKGKLREIVGHI